MNKKKIFSILIILSFVISLFLPFTQVTNAANQPIADGIYKIKATVGNNKYLDIDAGKKTDGANLQIWDSDESVDQQKFKITYSGGTYTITALHSGKVLDVYDAGKTSGTNVWQYKSNNTDAQKWEIKDVGNGKYTLISKCNNLALDVYNANSSNGTNVQVATQNGTNAQKFIFEKTKLIEDGTYRIKANVGNNKYLDIDAGKKTDGANLQIWDKDENVNQQKFKLTYSEGYYTIEAVHSEKVFDVYDASMMSGTNVWQYKSNNTNAQKWAIKEAGNGNYTLVSKCNNLALDVYNANSSNGTNVQVATQNGTNAQKFKFEKVVASGTPSPSPSVSPTPNNTNAVSDGDYMLKTSKGDFAVDVTDGSTKSGANIQIWGPAKATDESRNNKFHILKQSDGTYVIRAAHSEKVLDVYDAGKTSGTNVWQCDYNGTDAQKWYIKDAGNGYYTLVSKCNNLALDVDNAQFQNGRNIQVATQNGTDAQKFKLEKTEVKQAIVNGIYEIKLSANKNKVFDIDAGSMSDGALLQVWDRNGMVNQQKFKITYYADKDNYKIEVVKSGKVLDVPNAKGVQGARVQQCISNNTNAQRWKIIDLKDGTFSIVSECGGLYLDVKNGSTANGTAIQLCGSNGTASQKFIIEDSLKVGNNNLEDIGAYTKISSYRKEIQNIKNRHPNWDLNIYYTGLDWNEVIDGEFQMRGSSPLSLTQKGNQWRVDATRYDVSLSWFRASKPAIAYMMDPRNSFEDDYIFQFQDISSSSGTKDDIKKMVKGTFIDNDSCIQAILDAAKESNISPFHLASRIIQESGANGSSIMNGYSYGGKTVYNLFNINVSGNGSSGIQNGAKYAYDHGWFSKEASIKGGAAFLRTGYLNRGQTTAYFQKYNVVQLNGLYSNQYMQNIHAANSEGMKIYAGYKSAGLVDSHFSFAIPLYDNMPDSKAPRPLE